MSVPEAQDAHTHDEARTAEAHAPEAAAPEVEQVPGYHLILVDGISPRYVSDHTGYQTAYAHEARAHNLSIGK